MNERKVFMEKLNQHATVPFPLPDDKELLIKVINTYGQAYQVERAIEEMSELTKALLKERRVEGIIKPDFLPDICEEMADVIIMISQLLIIFDCVDGVQTYINLKMNRLESRLKYGDHEEHKQEA